jgi:hypothetical protein
MKSLHNLWRVKVCLQINLMNKLINLMSLLKTKMDLMIHNNKIKIQAKMMSMKVNILISFPSKLINLMSQ